MHYCLGISILFSFLLLVLRIYITGDWYFKFLVWNLFLAGLPLLASSFGIYLGRFLRWNSWDVLNNPEGLLMDIVDRVVHPLSHLTTFGVTFGLSGFLFLAYLTLRQ